MSHLKETMEKISNCFSYIETGIDMEWELTVLMLNYKQKWKAITDFPTYRVNRDGNYVR